MHGTDLSAQRWLRCLPYCCDSPCLTAPRGSRCPVPAALHRSRVLWSTLAVMGRLRSRYTLTLPLLPVPFQGFIPAAVRLIPHTILTFVFLEQLRKYFGIKVST